MSKKSAIFGPAAGALLLAGLGTAPLAAQDCSDVKVRLWQETGATWYEYGETVEITAGEEGHLYLHVRGKGPTPYSAGADIGYPSAFNLGGDSHRVRQHLRMEAQNEEDRRSGRVRFTAQQPGTAHLGYNIVSVKAPGDLRDLAPGCRLGKVAIRVVEEVSAVAPPPTSVAPPAADGGPKAAALELTELLYRGLLRRERHGEDPESFVVTVLDYGPQGVAQVAEQMTTSSEFRRQALDRTQRERAARSQDLAELRQWLLQDIYRDLYGLLEPTPREVDEDLRALDTCLSSDRNAQKACAELGRNLVSHRLFAEHNRETLGQLGRGFRQPRDRFRRP